MANLNITNSIDNILHYSRPRRKTDSAVDRKPIINLNSKSDATPSKPSTRVLQGLSRRRRSSSNNTPAPAPQDLSSWTTTTSTAGPPTSSLFATLTTPPVPSLPSSFFPLRSRTSKQRLRFSSPDMAAEPRDPSALEPLPATNSASTSSPSATGSAYLRPRFSHQYPSFFTSPEPALPFNRVDPPRTRFSFEYHPPLHEEALTASATTTAAQPQAKTHQRQHAQKNSVTVAVDNSASDSSDSSPRPGLCLHERRSVPNFSLPNVASQSSSAESSPKQHSKKQQQQQQQQQKNSSSTPLAPLDQNSLHCTRPREGDSTPGCTTNNALSTNAAKRKRRSTIIAQQASRPIAEDAMPLSTLTYSPARSSFVGDSKSRAIGNDVEKNKPNGTARNEDLFLNIAQSDINRRESLTRSESRRSRFGFNGASLRSPTSRVNNNRNTPSPEQLRTNNPLRARTTSYGLAHSSSASAHPLEDPGRSRYPTAIGSSSRSTIGMPRSRLSRTSPDASPKSPSTNVDRRSSLHEPRVLGSSTLSTIRSSRQPSVEAAEKPPEKARQDGSESTLSTNAPSTVWDELEDLKSRIRNLELTGKLPPSSQTAMSSAERPRTAATTITTFSSPPKHKRKSSTAIPDADTAQINPLLQSALAKAKSALGDEIYGTLEATVNDAVSLSALLNSGSGSVPSGSASVANGYGLPDKHSKRKADSVCRGLTELCIALSDAHFNQQQQQQQQQQQSFSDREETVKTTPQNGNTDTEPSTPVLSFQRSPSFEPEGMVRRRSTNRVINRLESRRTSLVNDTSPGTKKDKASPLAPDTKQTTPKEQPQPQSSEQSPQQPQTPSQPKTNAARRRPSRLSTSLRASTFPTEDKTAEAKPAEKDASHSRTLSRALTDIATPSSNRLNARHRFSSGYVPYRPSASNSPQEQSFTPQTPQTPSQQAPPPVPSHQPQPPLPSQQQEQQEQRQSLPRTPSLSGIPLRRSFMAPVNYTPGSSRSTIQAGSHRYGLSNSPTSTPGSLLAGGIAETTEPSQQQAPPLPSQTRIIPSSTKMASASSYTPIQQSRTRTGSLGTRRFGVNLDNMVHL